MGLIALGKQVETKISLLSAEKIALRRYFSRKENLDEHRLKYFILDICVFMCYTLVTVKKGDTKMNIFKRIKIYFFLKNLGINHPWKASGDKNFITFG